jgi:alpha,alpha-trehalase
MLGWKRLCVAAAVLFLSLGVANAQSAAATQTPGAAGPAAIHQRTSPQGLADILGYISRGWGLLTRSMESCDTFEDVKSTGKQVLYLPAGVPEPQALANLERNCRVTVRHLPAPIQRPGEIDVQAIRPQGLLYLPHPYVVPGGRFNEMYGWDSYFIICGLLQAGKWRLARGIVENFFYEIEHYGMVLNANRTYYLTRSQPPFLSSMIMAVYEREKSAGHDDRTWLEKAYPFAVRDYDFWTHGPHLAGTTGLSRYYGLGNGPAPEVMAGNPQYYRYVASYFLLHPEASEGSLMRLVGDAAPAGIAGPSFSAYLCQETKAPSRRNCELAGRAGLTANFCKNDRSMRESGFDVSFRFGPFGADTIDYAPVGLNSLLYKTEKELEEMSRLLGRQKEAREWAGRAALRRERIDKYLWNEKRGLYFDYDFVKRRQSSYVFATTFYPLWAGAASPAQARAVAANLKLFIEPGGLVTSLRKTEAQWDYPYGWAPLQLIGEEGLRRYGHAEKADQVAYRFLGTVVENFRRDGTIREKYNVVTRSSETQVKAGYQKNVIGFGWTNGVFLALLHSLPASWKKRLAEVPLTGRGRSTTGTGQPGRVMEEAGSHGPASPPLPAE